MLEETNASGVAQADYIYLNGRPVAVLNGSTLYYLHDDRLGTPQLASDSNQAVQWQASYDPFGQAPVSGTITQNLRLPGQYFDVESGWNHNGFRNYIPDLGRYAEPDPLGRLGSGNNLYVYVGNNPINLIDQMGLCPKCSATVPSDPTTATLAQLIYAEGNGTPTGDLAIASVVENRAISGMAEFPSSVQGVMTQQTKGGNYQFQAYGNTLFQSVGTHAQVTNLGAANCTSYQNAVTAATSAMQPDGIGTNTNALYYYDTSITQPGYITSGLNNGTLVPAPVAGGTGPNGNSVGGGSGSPQLFFTTAP